MEDKIPARPFFRPSLRWTILALSLIAISMNFSCASYLGTTAASFMRRAKDDPDPNVRYLAYVKLAQPRTYDNPEQKAEAVKLLLNKLDQGKEPVATRAQIVKTLAALRDPAAHDAIVKAVNDTEPMIRVQACRALGKLGRPEDATILTRVMSLDSLEDCRIAAIESLGQLKSADPRIHAVLVAGLRHEDPATRLASLDALRAITGKDLGIDPAAWQTILPNDQPKPETLIASPGATAPVYPPRPTPLAPIDLKTETAAYPSNPAQSPSRQQASAPILLPDNYPTHNPNLPATPAPR